MVGILALMVLFLFRYMSRFSSEGLKVAYVLLQRSMI